MNRKFVFKTISESLVDMIDGEPIKINIYNFSEGSFKFNLKEKATNRIGAFNATWIRIFNDSNEYYDFLVSTLFFVENKEGLILLSSEEYEYLDNEYFSKEISKMIREEEIPDKSNEFYVKEYVNKISDSMKQAFKDLETYYSLQKQMQSGKLSIEDKFNVSREHLSMLYLKGIVTKKVLKENKEEIMSQIEA